MFVNNSNDPYKQPGILVLAWFTLLVSPFSAIGFVYVFIFNNTTNESIWLLILMMLLHLGGMALARNYIKKYNS